MDEKRDDDGGAAAERPGAPRPGASDPAPLSEAALERLRQSAADPGVGAEFAELVRAFTALEAERVAALTAAQQHAFAAGQQQARSAQADGIRAGTHLVGGRLGMVLAIGAIAGSTALAIAYYGIPSGSAQPGATTRLVISQSPGSAAPTTAPVPSASAPSLPAGGGPGGVPGGAVNTPSGTAATTSPTAGDTATGSTASGGATTGSPTPSTATTTSAPTLGPVLARVLCRRYARGNLPPQSVGYARLAAAAGGVDKIEAYCAAVTAAASASAGAASAGS